MLPSLGTLVSLEKYQFPMATVEYGGLQQAVRSVVQSRASSPSPMSSRFKRLLFWYVVFLSEKVTLPPPRKEKISVLTYLSYSK